MSYDPNQPRDERGRWTDGPALTGEELRLDLLHFINDEDGEYTCEWMSAYAEASRLRSRGVDAEIPPWEGRGPKPEVEFFARGSQAGWVGTVRTPGRRPLVVKEVSFSTQTYDEVATGHIANAMGLPFDAYHAARGVLVVMPLVSGDNALDADVRDYTDEEIRDLPGSLEVFLLDVVTGNADRHWGNVIVADDGSLVPLDHSSAMWMDDRPLTAEDMLQTTHNSHSSEISYAWLSPAYGGRGTSAFSGVLPDAWVSPSYGGRSGDVAGSPDFSHIPAARVKAILERVEANLTDMDPDLHRAIVSRLRALYEYMLQNGSR